MTKNAAVMRLPAMAAPMPIPTAAPSETPVQYEPECTVCEVDKEHAVRSVEEAEMIVELTILVVVVKMTVRAGRGVYQRQRFYCFLIP